MDAADSTARARALPLPPAASRDTRVDARKSPAPRSVSLLEPSPRGPGERLAGLVGETHPVRVFLVTVIAGYALLTIGACVVASRVSSTA